MRIFIKTILITFVSSVVYGQGQTLNKSIMHNGIQRNYTIYVPSTYASQNSTPLVVNLHGYTLNRSFQMTNSGMNAVAEREGFLVAYPDAVNADWFGPQDNIGFVDQLLDDISSQYSVNAAKVYATGFSQGGVMSYLLSVERSDRFAAIASVGGPRPVGPGDVPVPPNIAATPDRPFPLLHIHGTGDPIVPYNGGTSTVGALTLTFPPVERVVQDYVTSNGGDPTPTVADLPNINTTDGTTVRRTSYEGDSYMDSAGNPRNSEVLFYRVQNGGHNWPGDSTTWPGWANPINYDISASSEIWNFFSRHEVALIPTWNVDAGGNWSLPANWNGAVPNAVGARAKFAGIINEPRTVTLDVPVTLGRLDFDSTNSYTIGGANPLTLDATSGTAKINISRGSHVIGTPVALADNAVINVAPAAGNLSITGALAADGKNITKVGAGSLTVNNVRASELTVHAGAVNVAPNGTADGTSVLGVLTIAGSTDAWSAKIDLANNDAIVRSSAANKAADFARLHNQVKQGFNNGNWKGLGITSTAAAANTNTDTGLTVADNALLDHTTFSGQPVTADSILLKYTYYGDIDQNGQVDADDLTVFASNFGRASGATQIEGDIDFNGAVNADDLTVFANNFNKGVGSNLAVAAASVQAVPEPRSAILLVTGVAAIATISTLLRRRAERQ
jgi:polyhydroxybutyrate depolymerase